MKVYRNYNLRLIYFTVAVLIIPFVYVDCAMSIGTRTTFANWESVTKCYGYIDLRVCTVYPSDPSNSSVVITDPWANNTLFQADNISETFSSKGLVNSYSRPTAAFFYAFVTFISGTNYSTTVCYRIMPSTTCTPPLHFRHEGSGPQRERVWVGPYSSH